MSLTGELDLQDEQALVEAIDELVHEGDHSTIVLDLSGLGFIDSSGVRALIRLQRNHGERIRVGDVSVPVARVLEIAGVAEQLRGDGVGA